MAIIANKTTPMNEINECLSLVPVFGKSDEAGVKMLHLGLLPHLLRLAARDTNSPDTSMLALEAMRPLCVQLSEHGDAWNAIKAQQKLVECMRELPEAEGKTILETIMNLTDEEKTAIPFSDKTSLAFFVSLFSNGALKPEHEDDPQSIPILALDCVCNLSMWEPIRPVLVSIGAVDALSPLLQTGGYASLRATMGLACLVGNKEDKKSKLLIAQPTVIERLINLLQSALRHEAVFEGYFSVEEVRVCLCRCVVFMCVTSSVSVCVFVSVVEPLFCFFCGLLSSVSFESYTQPYAHLVKVLLTTTNLSLSDSNKPLLGTPLLVDLLLTVLEDESSSEVALQRASSSLLELSFNDQVMILLKNPDVNAVRILEACAARVKGEPRHNVTQLLWAVDEKARAAHAPAVSHAKGKPGHVMMSYSWAHQVC